MTGVGLAQPNPNEPAEARNETARSGPPTGSKWAIGLSVRRPNSFAVPSPSRYAASAWENSWTGNPTSSMIATTMTIGRSWFGSRVTRYLVQAGTAR